MLGCRSPNHLISHSLAVRPPWARLLEVIFKEINHLGSHPTREEEKAHRACYTLPIDPLAVVFEKHLWRFLEQRSIPAVERALVRGRSPHVKKGGPLPPLLLKCIQSMIFGPHGLCKILKLFRLHYDMQSRLKHLIFRKGACTNLGDIP